LADNDLVTGLDTEGGGHVRGEVLVALLITGVLGDEVKVFAADDQSTCIPSVCHAKLIYNFLLTVQSEDVTYGASWST
jgi:hypothetical protein